MTLNFRIIVGISSYSYEFLGIW